MGKFEKFYIDFKSAFRLIDYISNFSLGRITGEFIKIALPPFIITTILGLISLLTNDKWDAIFYRIINEFIQMTGLKFFIYIFFIIMGLGLISYRFEVLTKITALVMNVLSKFGFTLNAVFTGTFSGIMIIDLINSEGNYFYILFYPFVITLFVFFIAIAKLFSTNIRKEIDYVFGNKTNTLTFILGVIVLSVNLYFLINEPWLEVGL